MLKKGSLTNLDVALSAVQPKKHKETKAAVAMVVKNAKCSQLFVLLVEKIRWFLSNHLVKNLSIVASVLYHLHVTTGKSLSYSRNLLGLKCLGRFFLYTKVEDINFWKPEARDSNWLTMVTCKGNFELSFI